MVSDPRAAAHQVLDLASLLTDLGHAPVILPPLRRPDADFLAATCGHDDPWLRRIAYSQSCMWAANAGTVARGDDGRIRLLMANLAALPHRQLETPARQVQLEALVPGVQILAALPSHPELGDEGAANHSFVEGPRGQAHLFVFGREAGERRAGSPARQTRQASAAAARRLGLDRPILIRQHPDAIDAGAFHNDVVMVGEGDRLLLHPLAWMDQSRVLSELTHRCGPLRIHETPDLSLDEAVRSYLFNSQLLSTAQGWMLVAPVECQDGPSAVAIRRLRDEGFIDQVHHVDLRQSMMGGGGPACLRLRIPGLSAPPTPIGPLRAWVDRHYRDRLALEDLADPALTESSWRASAEWPV